MSASFEAMKKWLPSYRRNFRIDLLKENSYILIMMIVEITSLAVNQISFIVCNRNFCMAVKL